MSFPGSGLVIAQASPSNRPNHGNWPSLPHVIELREYTTLRTDCAAERESRILTDTVLKINMLSSSPRLCARADHADQPMDGQAPVARGIPAGNVGQLHRDSWCRCRRRGGAYSSGMSFEFLDMFIATSLGLGLSAGHRSTASSYRCFCVHSEHSRAHRAGSPCLLHHKSRSQMWSCRSESSPPTSL